MRTVRSTARRKPKRRKPCQLEAEKLAPLLAELMPVGDGEMPIAVLGFRDRRGALRRVRADYPNGWQLTVRLNGQWQVTSTSASLRLVTKVAK